MPFWLFDYTIFVSIQPLLSHHVERIWPQLLSLNWIKVISLSHWSKLRFPKPLCRWESGDFIRPTTWTSEYISCTRLICLPYTKCNACPTFPAFISSSCFHSNSSELNVTVLRENHKSLLSNVVLPQYVFKCKRNKVETFIWENVSHDLSQNEQSTQLFLGGMAIWYGHKACRFIRLLPEVVLWKYFNPNYESTIQALHV